MIRERVDRLLELGLGPYEQRLMAGLLVEWADEFMASPAAGAGTLHRNERDLCEALAYFLKGRLQKDLLELAALRRRHVEFVKRYAQALSVHSRERCILDFARELGASRRQLRGDRKAFTRWFGADCVTERYQKQLHALEFRMTRRLGRLGAVLAELFSSTRSASERARQWERLALTEVLKPLFTHDGDVRVARAALSCLAEGLRAWPEVSDAGVDQGTLQFIYQSALHTKQDVWIQRQALELLSTLSPRSLHQILERRLVHPADGDDIFVRKRVVEILVRSLEAHPALARLLAPALHDASPLVRQGLARALRDAPIERMPRLVDILDTLALADPAPQVRAAALLTCGALLEHPQTEQRALHTLERSLQEDDALFVQRVALHVVAESSARLPGPERAGVRRALQGLAAERHRNATDLRVRRWAALAHERIWSATEPRAAVIGEVIADCVAGTTAGSRIRIPSAVLEPYDRELLGRVLAVHGQLDFGFDVATDAGGVRLTRGPLFGFRWWRLLHELRHPAPDKRQAFFHTVGRQYRGSLRAPSAILGELAETKVPGEPLYLEEEGGWRPYLPLPDEFLSSVAPFGAARSFDVYTSEGVTEVRPPSSWPARLRAAAALTWRLPEHARRRNWTETAGCRPDAYLAGLAALGFEIRLRPHRDRGLAIDPSVGRFFPGLVPFVDGDLWYELQEYFLSLYENSLFDLLLFTGGAAVAFLGRHWLTNRALRRARESLPLVIGGWGTRGKSGSERLKAGLISALGYGVVSKTTGCEAMFLASHPFGKIHEMFLFRSYDKATIWEQANLVDLASKLGADVFLWECMGLKPEYVDILQRQWMQDDLATLTNAYPDHEDLQGPAGFNIPEAMTRFIPEGSRLVTSEELMLPIIAEGAQERHSTLRPVSWLDSGLLTDDVLERFPYEEHPSNVAMVLALADELGVTADFALKEMADNVVPDLGVLKTYPAATVRGRRLQFTNGTSANDRHGALGNYRRLGFDRQDRYREPAVWKTTVVNNRADRIPRSRVFARILVADVTADRHYLIGTNLGGLVGYIHEAWDEDAARLSLWPETGDASPDAILEREARRRRIPISVEHVYERLLAMLPEDQRPALRRTIEAVGLDPTALRGRLTGARPDAELDAIIEHLRSELRALGELVDFRRRLAAANVRRATLEEEFRNLCWRWFERSLRVIEDHAISGDGLVQLIADDTPPGLLNRILGLQNIKGTGLDFVYRWQAWEACHAAGEQLQDRDPAIARRGLRALAAFREYGFLGEEYLREVLQRVAASATAQSEGFQAELGLVKSNSEEALLRVRETARRSERRGGPLALVLGGLEAFLDPGDSVKRRKTADRLYRDLVAERISSGRAAAELKGLIQRQKGGWLTRAFESLRRKFAASVRRLPRFPRAGARQGLTSAPRPPRRPRIRTRQ